jgi:uncharacterized repeat protein (TIGR01451 family)
VRRVDLATRWSPLRAALVLAFCAFAVLGWQGVSTIGRQGGDDAGEHLAYAQYLDAHHAIPGKSQNYEYATPPLFHAVAVAAEHAVRALPSTAVEVPWNPATRILWLVLVAAGAVALTSSRRSLRLAGAGGLALGLLWGLDETVSLAKTEPWAAGRLVALACGAGLILVTGLIAREVWPGHRWRWLAAGAFAAAYPVVYRMSILFHPEMPFALLCGLATLVLLRASRLGWPHLLGWWLGAALAAAALTRQPAVLVIGCLGAAALWLGGRRAAGFLARAAVVVVLVAGPWWGYAAHRWGNPLQSNLEPRASLMLDRQPASFYVSFPLRTVVVHPYRPDFSNELLPKLHAELWSDWFGYLHGGWGSPTRLDRVTASTQSVLGFVGDALAIGGLAAVALPAGVRLLRRRARPPSDAGLAVLALLALGAFAAFVVMLIRFPQQYGDPIKSSYLLFTAPCWAVFSVAAWAWLRERSRRLHVALAAVAVLYVASYGAALGAGLSHESGRQLGGAAGFVDLTTAFQQNSPDPGVGGTIDFLAGVTNNGDQTATGLVLTVRLPDGMRLVGPPFYERGRGCTGTRTITCDLDFLPAGGSTLIRYSVQVTTSGRQTMTAVATSAEPDARPGDNAAGYSVDLG